MNFELADEHRMLRDLVQKFVRQELSMLKVHATEMAQKIIDDAMQCLGGMGMTKESPLPLLAGRVRTMRIYDGPSEVHRMVIARNMMDTSA